MERVSSIAMPFDIYGVCYRAIFSHLIFSLDSFAGEFHLVFVQSFQYGRSEPQRDLAFSVFLLFTLTSYIF